MRAVEILGDWFWYETIGKWALPCQLYLESGPTDLVPEATRWFIVADDDYPHGAVKLYPAVNGGLEITFPHQSHNGVGNDAVPWRTGQICHSRDPRVLGRFSHGSEPSGADTRLRWQTRRALAWLAAAANGELVQPEDPFELPHLPGLDNSLTVAFAEDGGTLVRWHEFADRYGRVDFANVESVYFSKTFFRQNGGLLLAGGWGRGPGSSGNVSHGVWMRLDSVPRLPVWQCPATFGELRRAAAAQGLDYDDLLRPALGGMRDGKRHIAMIGFPIPVLHSGSPDCMHWQSLLLPVLSRGTQSRRGYRPNEQGYWLRDRFELLTDDAKIQWLSSENWDAEQLATRGQLPASIQERNVLLIGAGALGASLAELLVRGGAHRLQVVDGDTLEGGNLARHTLSVEDVNVGKASALAKKLNLASPHANVQAINRPFPPLGDVEQAQCRACDLIIDCTADDDVLLELGRFPWGGECTFISLSFGFGARRLFCFAARGRTFPTDLFRTTIQPWLETERDSYVDEQLPWEGIGCWHPVFPARADDVWLLAAAAAKFVASVGADPPDTPILRVLEQVDEDGGFAGLRRVDGRSTAA